jgi:DNA adenine methylase
MELKLRPIVGYVGGKRRFAKSIVSHFPKKYDTYYEPFIGMGAVFLELQPKKAVISDIDPDVINIWRQVKNNPKRVIKHLNEIGILSESVFKRCVYELQKLPFSPKRAALYILILKCSYGNIVRKTGNGLSTNFSRYWSGKNSISEYFSNNILNVSRYLNSIDLKIHLCTFLDTTRNAKRRDLIFIDPPYYTDNERDYYKFHNLDVADYFVGTRRKMPGRIFMSNSRNVLKLIPDKTNVVIYKKNFGVSAAFYDEVLVY